MNSNGNGSVNNGAESNYYCCAEVHIARLTTSRYAALLYPVALRISIESECFYGSQASLAKMFECSTRSITEAVRQLEDVDYFHLQSEPQRGGGGNEHEKGAHRTGQVNRYIVLTHQEWARIHPGQCVTKIELPWSGPELGRHIHAISGGRVKVRPEQIEHLQKRFTDDAIKQGFRKLVRQGFQADQHGILRDMRELEILCRGVSA